MDGFSPRSLAEKKKGKMKKIIFSFLMMVGSCLAQSTGANVVVLQVIPFQTITGVTGFVTGPLQNIGQTSHQLRINISAFNTGVTLRYGIQGSLDGVTWFSIGPSNYIKSVPLISFANINTFTTFGYGNYPYLRTDVQVGGTSLSSATISAEYVGNSAPAIVISDSYLNYVQMLSSATIMTNSSTPQQLLNPIGSGLTISNIVVYGVSLNLASTATSFELFCGQGGVPDNILWLLPNVGGSIMNLSLPMNSRPYPGCISGDNLYYEVTDSASGVNALNVYYRYE